MRLVDLSRHFGKSSSTNVTILAGKDAIKVDVGKGVAVMSERQPQIMEDVEKLLLVC